MMFSVAFGVTLAATVLGIPQPGLDKDAQTQLAKRIVGGNVAPVSKYPFASIIKTVYSDGSLSKCGGTIISRNHVVTAAHCVVRTATGERAIPKNTYAGYGNNVYISQTLVPSRRVFVHPQYNSTGLKNDIAVLELPDLPLDGVSVATVPVYKGSLFPGMSATAIGWGLTNATDPHSPSYPLKEAEVKIGSIDPCKDHVKKYLHDTFYSSNGPRICIERSLTLGNGTCSGDSGSALVAF
ncbi:Tryptase beta-2, partial [Linderina pennispora]